MSGIGSGKKNKRKKRGAINMGITEITVPKQYVVVQATEPTGAFEGQLWYDTENDLTYIYDSSDWVLIAEDLSEEITAVQDEVTALAGKLSFIYGDGTDGALNVEAGTTNLTLGKVYNYTTMNISAGATLSTTDSANYGKPMIIKVQGDCTIKGTINLSGKGFAGGTGAYAPTGNGAGHDNTNSWGSGGTAGGSGAGAGSGAGGSSAISNGTNGVGTAAGVGGKLIPALMRGRLRVFSGGGGGSGASAGASQNPAGGAGGGALILIVGGDLNFTGTINVSGAKGTNSAAVGGGGGGGGTFLILYNTATAISGTKIVNGGSGGTGTQAGGAGANGTYQIIPLSEIYDDYR